MRIMEWWNKPVHGLRTNGDMIMMAISFAFAFLAAVSPIVLLDMHGYKPEKCEYKYSNCCECDSCECDSCDCIRFVEGGGR